MNTDLQVHLNILIICYTYKIYQLLFLYKTLTMYFFHNQHVHVYYYYLHNTFTFGGVRTSKFYDGNMINHRLNDGNITKEFK